MGSVGGAIGRPPRIRESNRPWKMYDWFIPVLLTSAFTIIIAAVGIQIALDTYKRKKYQDSAPPRTVRPRRPAH